MFSVLIASCRKTDERGESELTEGVYFRVNGMRG